MAVTILHSNLSKLAAIAPDDTTRYALAGVRVVALEGGGYLVEATNGHILARVEGDAGDSYPTPPALEGAPNSATSALIPADSLLGALKSVPRGRKVPDAVKGRLAVVMGDKVSTLASADGAGGSAVSQPENVEGRFPNTDSVFPDGAPVARVRLDPALLTRLLAVALELLANEESPSVELLLYDSAGNKPVELRAATSSQKLRGLIMPMTPA